MMQRKNKKRIDDKNWIYYNWKWYGLPIEDKTYAMPKYEIKAKNSYQKSLEKIRKNKKIIRENLEFV